jgi:hypothetical protein
MPFRGNRSNLAAALMVGAAAVVVVAVAITAGTGVKPVARPTPLAPFATAPGPLKLSTPVPSPQTGTALAYDAYRHQVVLFGGSNDNPGQLLNDTWTLSGSRWTQRNPAARPTPLQAAQIAYDDRTHSCLLVGSGGQAGPAVTWRWDGNTWARLPDVPLARDETFQALAADPTTGHILLLSVVVQSNRPAPTVSNTWSWDGARWSMRHPRQELPAIGFSGVAGGPSLASVATAAPNRLGRGILAFLQNDTGTSSTWLWDGSSWSPRSAGAIPPYNPQGTTMAQDVTSGEVVLVAWGDGSGDTGSTWLWNGTGWRVAGPPPFVDALYGGASVLSDVASGHAIVIGNRTASGTPNQFGALWTFDGLRWVSNRAA